MVSPTLQAVLERLSNVKPYGRGFTAICPGHDDRENSLSVAEGEDGRILLKCFAGCSVEVIVQGIGLTLRDLFPQDGQPRRRAITVADLARDKRLPEQFLRSLGLRDREDGVIIPYRLFDGRLAPRQRLRTSMKANDGSLWLFGKGKPVPYGLDRVEEARRGGFIVFVEGESDCWTLWYHGLPALGIPGADMTSKLEASHLEGIPLLFVVREPGNGGETFTRGMAKRLRRFGWTGKALVVTCGSAKDPNDLHRADPAGFPAAFRAILEAATPLPVAEQEPADSAPTGDVSGALRSCGLSGLPLNPSLESVEKSLRSLKEILEGEDPLCRALARSGAIRQLEALGVSSPARLVDAALGGKERDGESNLQGRALILSEPTPWPESVDGSQLLEELVAVLERHVVLAKGAAVAMTLWILHSYALDATFISPILALVSPGKRCGKTTALDLVAALVPKKLPSSNISPASLYRTVEMYEPTLLVDEADTFLANNDDLRGILNAGHTRTTAIVIRTVGDSHEPRQFSTWCPKVIAMIGRPPDTLEDRSIVITMRRRARGEKVERLRRDKIDQAVEPLRRQAARWAADHLEDLREADPVLPDELDDRAQDNWRPLIAVADAVGGNWPKVARRAASDISCPNEDKDQSAPVQLLTDIRRLFTERSVDQLPSETIVQHLCSLEDRPWCEWNRGRPLSKAQLAKHLKPFGIRPRTIRVGSETPKGYRLADLLDTFERYLPCEPQQPQHPFETNGLDIDSTRNNDLRVAGAEQNLTDRKQTRVADVADENREAGAECTRETVADPSPAPPRESEPSGGGPCPACHERKYWRSIHGAVVCAICHPPPAPHFVTEWIDVSDPDGAA